MSRTRTLHARGTGGEAVGGGGHRAHSLTGHGTPAAVLSGAVLSNLTWPQRSQGVCTADPAKASVPSVPRTKPIFTHQRELCPNRGQATRPHPVDAQEHSTKHDRPVNNGNTRAAMHPLPTPAHGGCRTALKPPRGRGCRRSWDLQMGVLNGPMRTRV